MLPTHPSSGDETSRRIFLKRTTGVAAAAAAVVTQLKTPVYGQNQAPSANVTGANNRIVCGFVGIGGQGFGAHVTSVMNSLSENNTAIAAVCDVSKHRVENAKSEVAKKAEKAPDTYEDFHRVMDRKDIDLVFCATVDHWHTKVSIAALESGKHVYVEKPMTRYLGEAFQIYDAVKKSGKLLQVGSQGCSDRKWHKAAEWIQAGKIGPLVMSQGSYMRNNPKGEWNYKIQSWATPEDIDWKMWIGDQIKKQVAFNPDHYFRWRKYYPYCAGLLGDLFPHKLHPYMLATGNPQFPVRVASIGNKKIDTDTKSDGESKTDYVRDVDEIIQLIAEFPNGMVMHVTSSTVNETGTQEIIRGQKADLVMAGNRVELKPERAFAETVDPETSEAFAAESVLEHHKNLFDAIRNNKQPNANIDLAVKVQTVISLAEMSDRLGLMLYFDETTRKVTDGTGRVIQPITYGTLDLS